MPVALDMRLGAISSTLGALLGGTDALRGMRPFGRRIAASAEDRFADAVLPYLPDAYAVARAVSKNPSDADDIVQEACLKALQAYPRTTVTRPKPWLLAIVHNTAITWLARNRSRRDVSVDEWRDLDSRSELSDDRPGPEASLIARADEAALQAAIDALPSPFRETVILRDLEGYSYREIAEITQAPVGTVMSRLTRARARLVSSLGRAAE